MRARIFEAIEWVRRRAPRDGRLARALEPFLRLATIERGKVRPTWSFVRHRGLTIADGPFAGLRYSRWGAVQIPGLASRIGGTYEAELHGAVEELIAWEPGTVINIGAGDGLYVVGFGLRLPEAALVGYELDPYAASICATVAEGNGVASRLELRGECTLEALAAAKPRGRTVVLCDCEGAEAKLIDPERVGWLRSAALLIELHETFVPGVERLMGDRLEPSHRVQLIEPTRRYVEDHPAFWGVPGLSLAQLESLMSELRPWRTPWLLAMPRGGGR